MQAGLFANFKLEIILRVTYFELQLSSLSLEIRHR